MAEVNFEPHRSAHWIVCESSGRWHRAVLRFAPQILVAPRLPRIVSASVPEAMTLLGLPGPKVILWEFQRQSLVKGCECLTQAAKIASGSLQLVACQQIGERQQIALSELPVAGFLRHPEDLPRFKPMLQGYFARSH